jgi:Fe2+ transport system protein FeoA
MTGPVNTSTDRQAADPAIADGSIRLIKLAELEVGQCGLVHDLDLGGGDDNRLRTLGICPGRRVWMARRGDPMVLKVMGTRLGLAAELAMKVTVEICGTGCSGPADPSASTVSATSGGDSGVSGAGEDQP